MMTETTVNLDALEERQRLIDYNRHLKAEGFDRYAHASPHPPGMYLPGDALRKAVREQLRAVPALIALARQQQTTIAALEADYDRLIDITDALRDENAMNRAEDEDDA